MVMFQCVYQTGLPVYNNITHHKDNHKVKYMKYQSENIFCSEALNKRDLCSLRETEGSVVILRRVHIHYSNSWQRQFVSVCVTGTANHLHLWKGPAPPLP